MRSKRFPLLAMLSMSIVLSSLLVSLAQPLPGGRHVIPGLPPGYVAPAELEGEMPQTGSNSGQSSAARTPAKDSQAPSYAGAVKGKAVVRFPENTLPQADETSGRSTSVAMSIPVTSQRVGLGNAATVTLVFPKGYEQAPVPLSVERHHLYTEAIRHFNRGNYYGQRSKLDDAIAEYKMALVLNPAFADAYAGLATAHMHRGEWENVLQEARAALQMKKGFTDPTNISLAQFDLAAAYCATDERGEAARLYRELKKNHYPPVDSLGQYIQTNCKP